MSSVLERLGLPHAEFPARICLLTINASGSFIKLDASGITVSGALANLNSGGSAGEGTGIGIKSPVLPGVVDQDKAGSLLGQALVNVPEQNTTMKPERMLNFSG